jgi:hypothetical protein
LGFFYLDEKNKEFILKISQRLDEHIRHWASLWDIETKDLVYKIKDGKNTNRYAAVNTQNTDTYEIRIFRGTLNFKSFCKNIEFCYALYNWTKELSNEPFIESLKKLIVKNFVFYIERNKKTYINLYNFMVNRKLCA